jgi:uncharacterized Zn-binding protein involved in type VI secretion
MPRVARIGDPISHGGNVITGSNKFQSQGIPVARVGDLVNCAVDGINPIISGSPHLYEQNRAVARVGSLCQCGAIITDGASKHETD